MLHAMAIHQSAGGEVIVVFFIIAFLNASRQIMSLHHNLMNRGNHTLVLLRNDGLRVALTSAHVASVTTFRDAEKTEKYLGQWLDLLDQSLHI